MDWQESINNHVYRRSYIACDYVIANNEGRIIKKKYVSTLPVSIDTIREIKINKSVITVE